MPIRPLRINFVVGFVFKTGGIAVVLEYAHRLGLAGHSVRIYYPLLPYDIYTPPGPAWKRLLVRIRNYARYFRARKAGIPWSPHPVDVKAVPVIAAPFIRDADAVIATDSPTAPDVARLPRSKGAKFYFIQGYEIWNGRIPVVEASYKLPLSIIVIAPWLTRMMRDKFGVEPAAEIPNGVDLDFFRPPARYAPGPPSVVMMYHVQAVKGIPDGLEVLRRLHRERPGVAIRLFGLYPFPDKDDFFEFTLNPSREKIRELYQANRIFLSPSHSEGWQLPPMEAMACGCAVVATNVGCIPVLKEEGNMLVAEPRDTETLFRHLLALVDDPELLRRTSEKGYATISRYGWDAPTRRLERLLAEGAEASSASDGGGIGPRGALT
jgi:glycosyltransferase involved in cell wall biosynthesis